MKEIDPAWLTQVRSEYGHCFGCGLDNPIGLQVSDFSLDGDEVTASFRPQHLHRGFHDVLHGGIVATALDEILAWTGILVAGTMAVTGKLEFRFRNPAPPDADYQLVGRLVEQRGRRLVLEGSCRTGNMVVAEAKGLFLATDPVALPEA